ncbi:hypothetical protein [Gaiella sp.]|uniref:hypothetical protein n=1 Tax=Gaiella sp. TaxID=2663207 RepID=UPI003265B79E
MSAHTDDTSLAEIVDAGDRAYVGSLSPGPERDAVVASLLRYRSAEALHVGDPLPAVAVRRADDFAPIELTALVRSRPLLLVFGSFT